MTNIAVSLWWSLKPFSMTLILWKESGLFVRIKSIVDLCVFVMQVSFLSKCCRLNKLHGNKVCVWFIEHINESDSSLKNWTKFWELRKQFHFILEIANSEHIHSKLFGCRCVCLLQIKPFLTNSSKPPPRQALSFLALISKLSKVNCFDGTLSSNFVSTIAK